MEKSADTAAKGRDHWTVTLRHRLDVFGAAHTRTAAQTRAANMLHTDGDDSPLLHSEETVFGVFLVLTVAVCVEMSVFEGVSGV